MSRHSMRNVVVQVPVRVIRGELTGDVVLHDQRQKRFQAATTKSRGTSHFTTRLTTQTTIRSFLNSVTAQTNCLQKMGSS